jgi:hypothetical protein
MRGSILSIVMSMQVYDERKLRIVRAAREERTPGIWITDRAGSGSLPRARKDLGFDTEA